MLKGAMHIHSTYSDGELTLRDLREELASAGCSFACVTDHAEAFDFDKLSHYADECAALSDEGFLFIAGLEFECEKRMHILGFGLLAILNTQDPVEVIREIEARGGISVIAHPGDSMSNWIESFSVLPCGLEVWNTKYDGKYAPRPSTFRLLEQLQTRQPQLLAMYGQDFHWKLQYREMFNWVWTDTLERNAILRSIREGKYHAAKGGLELPSNGRVSKQLLERFDIVQRRWTRIQRFCRSSKKALDAAGLGIPNYIKTRLRRIF
jgi:hypothetical protein